MIVYKVEGVVEKFDELPENAEIISIDGKEYVGRCECCEKHIVTGDLFCITVDEVHLCKKCLYELMEEEICR